MGWSGRVYLGRDARYVWQSCWIPEARMNKGVHSSVRLDGAERDSSFQNAFVARRVPGRINSVSVVGRKGSFCLRICTGK